MTPKFWLDQHGHSYSADPPTTYLTFSYWIYMVPQYRPESILMLGYGGGTVAGLIRLLYGNIPITAVDILPCDNQYGVELIQADAQEFVKTCGHYDAVLVDLFSTQDSCEACPFISSPEFVADLKRIANYIVVNGLHSDMTAYNGLRRVGINKPSGSAEQIYYYEVNKIPHLHPWKE